MVGERGAEIFDFLQNGRTDVKLNLNFAVSILSPGAEVGDLQFDLAELGDNIMETIAQDRLILFLKDLEIEFLKKFVFPFYQLLLADPE